jgi:hypothetical protein
MSLSFSKIKDLEKLADWAAFSVNAVIFAGKC